MTKDDFKYKTMEDLINILELFNDELQECKEKIKQLEEKTNQLEATKASRVITSFDELIYGTKN